MIVGNPRWKALFASLYHSLKIQFTHITAVTGQDRCNYKWPTTTASQIIYLKSSSERNLVKNKSRFWQLTTCEKLWNILIPEKVQILHYISRISLSLVLCVCVCVFIVFDRNFVFYSEKLFSIRNIITKSWDRELNQRLKFTLNGIVKRARHGKRYHILKLQNTFQWIFLAHHINNCSRIRSISLWYLHKEFMLMLLLDDRFLFMTTWRTFTHQLYFHHYNISCIMLLSLGIVLKIDIVMRVMKLW